MEGGTDMASSLEMIRKQRQALQPERKWMIKMKG